MQPRRKSPVACDVCARGKRKCDGLHPCARCTHYSKSCTYGSLVGAPTEEGLQAGLAAWVAAGRGALQRERRRFEEERASEAPSGEGLARGGGAPTREVPPCLYPWRRVVISVSAADFRSLRMPSARVLGGASVASFAVPPDSFDERQFKRLCGCNNIIGSRGGAAVGGSSAELSSESESDASVSYGDSPAAPAPATGQPQGFSSLTLDALGQGLQPQAASGQGLQAEPSSALASSHVRLWARVPDGLGLSSAHMDALASCGASEMSSLLSLVASDLSPPSFLAIYHPASQELVHVVCSPAALQLFGWMRGEPQLRIAHGLPLPWLHPSDILPRSDIALKALTERLPDYFCSGLRYLHRRPLSLPLESRSRERLPSPDPIHWSSSLGWIPASTALTAQSHAGVGPKTAEPTNFMVGNVESEGNATLPVASEDAQEVLWDFDFACEYTVLENVRETVKHFYAGKLLAVALHSFEVTPAGGAGEPKPSATL